jgi:putative membrane protein
MNNHDVNKDALAQERTLLAAERTFSAWVRTALAAMAGGLAILRLITFKTELHRIMAHTIGEILIVWGCALVILASMDYKRIRKKLSITHGYKSSTVGFFVIVAPLVLLSILLVWLTLP